MKVQLDNSSSNTWSISGEQISRILLCLKTCSDQNFVPMATWDKNSRSLPSIPYPFYVELFLSLVQNSGIGYQYLTKILGLGINIGPNFWDWVVVEILEAHTPV